MAKTFCYVDESGSDTRGELFVVAVVMVDEVRDELAHALEAIEQVTGKARRKWTKTMPARRLAYLQRSLALPALRGRIYFAMYHQTQDYFALMVQTIIAASNVAGIRRPTIILIDALPSSQVQVVGSLLRRAGVSPKKVRGVRKDENDALIRLADAICGFVRAAYEGDTEWRALLERAMGQGVVRAVSGQ